MIDTALQRPPTPWKWIFGYGEVLTAIGLFDCCLPNMTALALETISGVLLIVVGAVQLVQACRRHFVGAAVILSVP